jgi:hypothetical protein
MKRHWRRVVLLSASLLLALVLIMLGAVVWLHASGRLVTVAEHLLHRLSGQHITFETIEFPSWNIVALTNVRLQQQIPGWRLVVDCPRLEAHYGVAGLLNKQVNELRLQHLQMELSASDVPPSAAPPVSTATPRPVTTLPFKRLRLQQGMLQVRWREQTYAVRQLEAFLQHQGNGHVQGTVQGSLAEDTATFQGVIEVFPGATAPTARLQLTAEAIPVTLLTRLLSPALPAAWKITEGTLHLETTLALQEHTVHGTVTTSIMHMMAQGQGTVLQNASLTSTARLEANIAQQTCQLDGQSELHVERLHQSSDLVMTAVTLTGPWRLSYAPEGWQVTATPTLLGQAVALGTRVRATHLALTAPVDVQSHTDALQIRAMPTFTIQALHLHAAGRTEATIDIADVQGQLSLHGSPTTLEMTAAHLQTGNWRGVTPADAPLLTTLTLESAGTIDLQRQQLTLPHLVGTLPPLGSLRGSGAWHWASHTVHDLRLQVTASNVSPVWDALKNLLPETARAWQTAGECDIQLHATRLVLQIPRQVQGLTVTWQVRHGAFSTAESAYASEHLNGTLQAVASLDEAAGQYTLQGTLTVQPFALLIGSFFPALEANHITSVVTFSADYSAHTERLQLSVAGQFQELGMLTVRGTIHQPRGTPSADLQLQARNINVAQLWGTFVHDALQFPTLSQAQAQGTVNATLDVLHESTTLILRGTVDVVQGQFHTATWGLHGLSLFLPVQLQYPLPRTAPAVTTLSDESFGQLHIDTLRLGSVDIHSLSLKPAVWSDNIFVRDAVSIPLLGGQISIDHISGQHLLQPHRLLTLPVRLHHLDLQQLHREAAELPLAGILDGDFSPVQLRGDRLEMHGALTVQVAGGVLRIFDLHGSEVLSTLPTFGCSVTTETPLSLRRITDIYPIGDIGGTLHFSVTDLTLTAGEPATFVLEFAVQDQGGEDREITIRALNNLLFTTGSAKVAIGVFGDTYRLPYKHFGAVVTLRHDTLRLRGKYHDNDGTEYFMQAPLLGGVSIVNRVPHNGISFRDFLQRLKATVLEKAEVQVQ